MDIMSWFRNWRVILKAKILSLVLSGSDRYHRHSGIKLCMHLSNWWWRKCPLAILFQYQHSLTVCKFWYQKYQVYSFALRSWKASFWVFYLPLLLLPLPPNFFFLLLSSVFFHIWGVTDTAVSSYRPSVYRSKLPSRTWLA